MYGDKGYVLTASSPIVPKLEKWLQQELATSNFHGCTEAYKERNVYNIYIQTEPLKEKDKKNEKDICPLVPGPAGSPATGEKRSEGTSVFRGRGRAGL